MKKQVAFSSREQMVEHVWGLLQGAGQTEKLFSAVLGGELSRFEDASGFQEFLKTIIELSWKEGFSDGLQAMEMGAIHCLKPNGN